MDLRPAVITTWPLDPARGSGTARFVRSICGALEQAGASPLLLNPTSDLDDYVAFTLRRVADNLDLASHAGLREASAVLALDYDGFACAARPGQRFIVTPRAVFADLVETEPEPMRGMLRLQAMLERRNVARADCVVVPSAFARGRVVELYGVAAERVRVIRNGIDLAEWDALSRAVSEPEAGGRDEPPVVLAVSRLYPRKMIETLVRATPLLRRRYPDVRVRIVGGGFQWNELRSLALEVGAEANIAWLGDIADRARIVAEFRRCHVFTHPSIQDAFANVCLEAMAAARPLVVADAGSMPELVRAAGSGIIVPPRDPEALAEALLALLADASRREAMGRAGRAFAEGMSWEGAAAEYLALLDSVVRDR